MNTAFLSTIPSAPPQESPAPARPAKSGKPVIETDESTGNAPVSESESAAGDSDKADAFAEMLAAMLSVETPATQVKAVEPAPVETAISTTTDVPRDGGGAPLFATTLMASNQLGTDVAATTINSTFNAELPTGQPAGDAGQTATAVAASSQPVIELTDAAAAELAALDAQSGEVAPESPSSTIEFETPEHGLPEATPEVAETTAESELPLIGTRETTFDSSAARTDTVETPEPVVAVDQRSGRESANTTSPRTDARTPTAPTPEVVEPLAEAAHDQPVAEPTAPVVSETKDVDAQPVPAPEAAVQDFTPVEEPYEDPVEPRADVEDRASVKSTAPRKASPSVSSPAPASAEPEPVNALPAVEASAEIDVRKDVVRQQAPVPIPAADNPADVVVESEATLSTVATTGDASASQSASSIATAHSDSAAASTPAHVSQQVLQALAAYEAELPQGGSRSFEMLLDPPELGRLLVQMSRTSKGVDVRIAAENETVRSILETTGAEMQQSLQLSGFDLGQFSGSNSGGAFANGEEWVAAPTLQSFAAGGSVHNRSNTKQSGNSAVNVMV